MIHPRNPIRKITVSTSSTAPVFRKAIWNLTLRFASASLSSSSLCRSKASPSSSRYMPSVTRNWITNSSLQPGHSRICSPNSCKVWKSSFPAMKSGIFFSNSLQFMLPPYSKTVLQIAFPYTHTFLLYNILCKKTRKIVARFQKKTLVNFFNLW